MKERSNCRYLERKKRKKKYSSNLFTKKTKKMLKLSDKYEKLYRKMKPKIIETIEKKARAGNKEYIIFLINCYRDGHHAIQRDNLKAAEFMLLLNRFENDEN